VGTDYQLTQLANRKSRIKPLGRELKKRNELRQKRQILESLRGEADAG